MPDTFNRTVFEADFEASNFAKGIDGMVNALKRAQDAEAQLAKENELTKESLKGTEEGIKKLTARIAALDKTNKDYEQTNLRLTGNLKALQGQYDKYTATIEKQRKELEASRATIAKMTAGYDAAKKAVIELQATAGKPIAPAMNDGKLTATIGGIRDKVKGMGANIVQSIDATAPAIDNVSNSVEGLGGAFGPAGVAAGVALGFIAKKLYEIATAETAAERAQKLFTGVLEASSGPYANAISDVSRLKEEISLAKDKFLDKDQVVKEYNETIGKTTGLVKNLDEAEQALNKNAEAYIKFTFLKAVANEANAQAARKSVEAELAKLKPADTFVDNTDAGFSVLKNFLVNPLNNTSEALANAGTNLVKTSQANRTKIIDEANSDSKALSLMAKKYGDEAAALAKQFGFNPFGDNKTTKDKAAKNAKEIENIYQQELEKLKSAIAKMDEKTFTNEASIKKALDADFDIRKSAYTKAFKKGQLSESELNDLNSRLKDLYTITLNKNIKDFQDARAKYIQGVNDALTNLQNEESLKRIANIQDSFERERQAIAIEQDKTIAAANQKRNKQIADLKKNAPGNNISDEELQRQIAGVNDAIDQFIEDVKIHTSIQLQDLSFKIFEKLSDDLKSSLETSNLNLSENSLIDIKQQTTLFTAGKISYQEYQKELTRIAKEESDARTQNEIDNLRKQIRIRENQLVVNNDNLSDSQKEKLTKEVESLQKQLTAALTGQTKDEGAPGKKGNDDLKRFNEYANAIKGVTDAVISFWAQMNEAEQKALDRSIAIQDRRVEAARNVAAKGNAEYLRMEEEREQQLLIKKENAARRQIAINAAIQASSILVAVAGAVAKIADGATGPVETIASIGIIVASLAAGYALVKSMQQNQPSFYVGTEDTGHGGRADEKGGFHAVLHPHERVLTAEENKQLKGLSNKQVVELVQKSRVFVEQWKTKPAPSLNMAAMEMANKASSTQSVQVAALMEENNKELKENKILQKSILKTLKGMGMAVSIDQRGFVAEYMKNIEDINKSKTK